MAADGLHDDALGAALRGRRGASGEVAGLGAGESGAWEEVFHLVKCVFFTKKEPGFTGNLSLHVVLLALVRVNFPCWFLRESISLLEICLSFPGDLSNWRKWTATL